MAAPRFVLLKGEISERKLSHVLPVQEREREREREKEEDEKSGRGAPRIWDGLSYPKVRSYLLSGVVSPQMLQL